MSTRTKRVVPDPKRTTPIRRRAPKMGANECLGQFMKAIASLGDGTHSDEMWMGMAKMMKADPMIQALFMKHIMPIVTEKMLGQSLSDDEKWRVTEQAKAESGGSGTQVYNIVAPAGLPVPEDRKAITATVGDVIDVVPEDRKALPVPVEEEAEDGWDDSLPKGV